MTRRTTPFARIVAAALLMLAVPGCLTVQPAAYANAAVRTTASPPGAEAGESRTAHAPEPESRLKPERWPERWGDERAGSKGIVIELPDPAVALRGRRVGRFHDLRGGPAETRLVEQLARERVGPGGYRFRLEGPGAYIFGPESVDSPRLEPKNQRPEHAILFVSGEVVESTHISPDGPEERVILQRTWASVLRHRRDGRTPASDDPGRGLVVVAPGLFGVPDPVITSVVNAMRNDGWNVLRVLAPPARFTERQDISLIRVEVHDEPVRPVESGDGVIVAKTAVSILYDPSPFAETAGHRIAEYAYACEAFVRWVRTNRPDLFPGATPAPAPLIAMSGGAISAPAIIARAPDLYAGALLIAGGGDMLSITAKSTYTKLVDAVRLDWTAELPESHGGPADFGGVESLPPVLDAVVPMYLRRAPLDPLNLAPALAGRRFVMLQGTNDKAVPSEHGDQLWEALGRPERWLTPLDHGPLFVGLFIWTPRILEWLDRETEAISAATLPAGAPMIAEP